MLRLLSGTGLATVAVTLALTVAPSPADADAGYCLIHDNTGMIVDVVAEGALYRAVDRSNPNAVITTVYRCQKTLYEGESSAGVVALGLVYVRTYCEGTECGFNCEDGDSCVGRGAGGHAPVLS